MVYLVGTLDYGVTVSEGTRDGDDHAETAHCCAQEFRLSRGILHVELRF